MNIMKKKPVILLPSVQKNLSVLGEDIKLARLRRKLSSQQVAERANLSRTTVWQVEKGSPGVTMGAYVQILFVLGLDKNLPQLANDDILGRKLQDAGLLVKERAPKKLS